MTDNIRMISFPECSGHVSLVIDDGIRIRLDLHLAEMVGDTDVLKVYASSSRLPDIYLGIADIRGEECHFEGATDTKDAQYYDTVTVVKKNAFTDLTSPFIKVCFADAVKEDDRASEQLEYLQSHSVYRDYLSAVSELKSPTLRGAEALDAFRGLHKNIDGERDKCLKRIKDVLMPAETAGFSLADGFDWYKADMLALSRVSTATEHILSHLRAESSAMKHGHIVAGFNWETSTLCVALPVNAPDENPIPHLSDCIVFEREPDSDAVYCTVCVIFAPDGQYFARLNEIGF